MTAEHDIRVGNCIDVLRTLPAESVHLMATSPPYWALRNYNLPPTIWPPIPAGHWADGWGEADWAAVSGCEHEWGVDKAEINEAMRGNRPPTKLSRDGNTQGVYGGGVIDPGKSYANAGAPPESQYCRKCGAWRGSHGLEPTVTEFVWHVVLWMREVRRVLRDDSCAVINLADTYAAQSCGGSSPVGDRNMRTADGAAKEQMGGNIDFAADNIGAQELCGIPERVKLALQADGWRYRSDMVWAKKSAMPEAVNGWRWERHKVKVGNAGRTQARRGQGLTETKMQDHSGNTTFSDAKWSDCPGCPACSPHGGLVLRKGQWRATRAHEYLMVFAKGKEYYADREGVAQDRGLPSTTKGTGRGRNDSLEKYGVSTGNWAGGVQKQGGANPRSVQYFKDAGLAVEWDRREQMFRPKKRRCRRK